MSKKEAVFVATAFAAFFAWLALSSVWSSFGPDSALRLGAQLALSFAIPVLILTRSDWTRTLLAQILMAMALAGAAVMALDVASGYGISLFVDPVEPGGDLNRRQGEAEMNVGRGHLVYALTTPLLLGLFATHLPKGRALPAAIVFIALVVIGSLLNRLAIVPAIMIAAAPVVWLGYKSPIWGLRLSLGIFAASILFAPFVGLVSRSLGDGVMARLPMSWDHRVRMWDYSLSRISESPWLGQGIDSSRIMQEGFTTRIGVDIPFISLHPHNVGLQTWMESGIIGAVLLTLAILSLYPLLRRLVTLSFWRGAVMAGIIMGTAVASAVTVGAWQYWWWGLVAIALSLVVLIPKSVPHDPIKYLG